MTTSKIKNRARARDIRQEWQQPKTTIEPALETFAKNEASLGLSGDVGGACKSASKSPSKSKSASKSPSKSKSASKSRSKRHSKSLSKSSEYE